MNKLFICIIVSIIISISITNSVSAVGEFLNMSTTGVYENSTAFVFGSRSLDIDSSRMIAYVGSVSDWLVKINISNSSQNLTLIGSYTDSGGACSINQLRSGSVDPVRNIFYAGGYADDYLTLLNVTPDNPTCLSSYTNTTSTNVVDGIWDAVYWNGNEKFVITTSQLGYRVAVFNVTNPSVTPVLISSIRNTTSLNFPYSIMNPPGTNYFIIASSVGDSLTVFNISVSGTLQQLSYITQANTQYSLDGVENFRYENSTGLVYAAGRNDKQLSIYNFSNMSNPVAVGNITLSSWVIDVAIATIGTSKYAFLVANTSGVGVIVVNVTNPALPRYVQTYTSGIGGCTFAGAMGSQSLDVLNNYLYVTDTDNCFYAIKLFDYVLDSCSYSGSGNWNIVDHCNLVNTNYNVAGIVNISATGWLNISGSSILNATSIRWVPKDAEEAFRLRWLLPSKVRWG